MMGFGGQMICGTPMAYVPPAPPTTSPITNTDGFDIQNTDGSDLENTS